MNDLLDSSNIESTLLGLFYKIRSEGSAIVGIRELLDVMAVINTVDINKLKIIIKYLWCKDDRDYEILEQQWNYITHYNSSAKIQDDIKTNPMTPTSNIDDLDKEKISETPEITPINKIKYKGNSTLGALPFNSKISDYINRDPINQAAMQSYGPVSDRALVYALRRLGKNVSDGPRNVLNVTETVRQSTNNGFLGSLIYDRQSRKHIHLVMFVDQEGSMEPFQWLTRNVIKIARDTISNNKGDNNIALYDVYYYHNIPYDNVYTDPFMTIQKAVNQILDSLTNESYIVIISDAGAARRNRYIDRVINTAFWIASLRRFTNRISWLNPMPSNRWLYSSAELISSVIPMYTMDSQGVMEAMNTLRSL